METLALRLFYHKQTKKVVWYHELRGSSGVFPTTIAEDLEELPIKRPTPEVTPQGEVVPGVPLGGVKSDYECYETTDQVVVDRYFGFHGSVITISKVTQGG